MTVKPWKEISVKNNPIMHGCYFRASNIKISGLFIILRQAGMFDIFENVILF
jgi:hypothetical protein